MKKKLTRLFSVLLAAVLVFGTLPVSAMGTDVADPPASAVDDTPAEVSAAEPEEASVVDETPDGEEAQSGEVETAATYASADVQYKIVHLDCGRKYFSKDWIIALLYEMKNDGYNQLQLAFGNDGLRFLLDDMSFEANGTTYDNDTVVAKVKAGNKAQNSSGDESYLTQSEMDAILAKANELDIEIVPLLNLPGHANAILDIVDDRYNASGSNNTLNVADSVEAREFGMAIFKKYVDYFSDKGCRFFNFGADEYANDATGAFSFSRLNSTQYQAFVSFINDLAGYVINKNMTPRAFNDGFYYNSQNMDANTSLTSTQICYWSPGWSSYNLAAASTIKSNQHSLINTNGDYYYVLGKHDKFTPETQKNNDYQDGVKSDYNTHDPSAYMSASSFDNSVFPTYTWSGWGTESVQGTAGSMFCIWCDYPNFETEQEVAANTRLVLRAMAQRMNNETVSVRDNVVANGFNADGTINNTVDDSLIKISIGDSTEAATSGELTVNGTMTLKANKQVDWTTSDAGVASIAASGTEAVMAAVETGAVTATAITVKAVAPGNATITAAADGKTATYEVTVNEPGTKNVTVTVGKTVTLDPVAGKAEIQGEYDTTVVDVIADHKHTSKKDVYTKKSFESQKTQTVTLLDTADSSIKPYELPLTIEYDPGFFGFYASYYLKNGDGSYICPTKNGAEISDKTSVDVLVNSDGSVTISKTLSDKTYYLTVNEKGSLGSTTTKTSLYAYEKTTTGEDRDDTTISFTGKNVGKTSVN